MIKYNKYKIVEEKMLIRFNFYVLRGIPRP